MIFIGFQKISWDCIDFGGPGFGDGWRRLLPRSCPYRNLYSIPAGCYFIDFHVFLKFSMDFMRFHGFQGSGVGAGCYFIDFHGFLWFSWDFMNFHRFLWILWISIVIEVRGHNRLLPRSCPHRNFYSIPAGCYFIDLYGFSWFSWISIDFHGFCWFP